MDENLQSGQAIKKFYFFVNSKSGDGEGAKLIQITKSQRLYEGLSQNFSLTCVDLYAKQQLEKAMDNIRQEVGLQAKQIFVIICGGDGTISWVLNQILKSRINFSSLTFGLFPIGTGNDMCRSLGWDLDSFEISIRSLKKIISKWVSSTKVKYDIWEVTLQTFKNGKIYSICNKVQKQNEGASLKKIFTNYVGLSMDARVVYTMQKYRTPSACINKVLYGLVGCLKFFKPLKQLYKKINRFTDKCYTDRQSLETSETDSSLRILKDMKDLPNQRSLLNATNIGIKKGYRGMVCLNCTSYMCGLRNVWETEKIGSKQLLYEWKPQSFNDGMVQFVAYKTELNLALERIIRSGAKISQGCGPFQITMGKPEKNEIQYMQIDGQSVKIRNLRSIKISKCSQIADSKINILSGF